MDEVGLADTVHVAARLAARQDACPDALGELFSDFALYERDLELLGVSDAQLVAGSRRHGVRLSVAWSALKVLVALPFAAVGALVHVVPFQIMKQVGKRPANEGIKATVKLLGCFVLFAATYAVVGVLVGRAYGAVGRARRGTGRTAVRLCHDATPGTSPTDRRRGRGVPDRQGPSEPPRTGVGAPCHGHAGRTSDPAAGVRPATTVRNSPDRAEVGKGGSRGSLLVEPVARATATDSFAMENSPDVVPVPGSPIAAGLPRWQPCCFCWVKALGGPNFDQVAPPNGR